MGTGVVVMIIVIAVLVGGGLFFVTSRKPNAGVPAGQDTVNPHPDAADGPDAYGPTPDHPVSETPYDTLAADGSGTAIAGGGAGGYTPDARRPLTSSGGDAENSPDT